MNCANSYALAWLLSQPGVSSVVFSSEMNQDQIKASLDAFEERYGFRPFVYSFVYGRRVLMYIRNGFPENNRPAFLTDKHGNNFEVSYNRELSKVYESEPHCSENRYCGGSFLIPDPGSKQVDRILEEAYEEIHGRV
jgi:putative protease